MDPLKMYFLLNMVIFHCYVSLPEGIKTFHGNHLLRQNSFQDEIGCHFRWELNRKTKELALRLLLPCTDAHVLQHWHWRSPWVDDALIRPVFMSKMTRWFWRKQCQFIASWYFRKLSKTNMAPEHDPWKRRFPPGNHHFQGGSMLVFQGVPLPKTNISRENRASQKESSLPTIIFQGLW